MRTFYSKLQNTLRHSQNEIFYLKLKSIFVNKDINKTILRKFIILEVLCRELLLQGGA